jgi:UPF0755 protein
MVTLGTPPASPGSGRRRWAIRVATGVVAAAVAAGLVMAGLAPPHPGSGRVVVVTIPPGATAAQIGVRLARSGVIRSALMFRLVSRLTGLDVRLRAGTYALSPGWSLSVLVRSMEDGSALLTRVVVPPGATAAWIAAQLVAAGLARPDAVQRALRTPLPGLPDPPAVRVPTEGFLFPGTYWFRRGLPARTLVLSMYRSFLNHTRRLRRALAGRHLSLWRWVTLASVVQAEDAAPSVAADVSAVFWNRLRQGMPLQSDATVRYALARPVARVTIADERVRSRYNTYRYPGLPPGPIDSPGLTALRAALYPATVPYLYFVTSPNGHIWFARTYAGQLRHERRAAGMTGRR